ncbi:sulfur carrier protein ThiS [Hypericibacter sp.]|uniref:sulfur carrier protein ThiS n=1 Tax=Hypericibacter sp. TaxID=2705401 RepID=UPI003D6C849D
MTGIAVILNGRAHSADTDSLIEFLKTQGVDPARRFVAVAVNGVVVPREGWPGQRLAAGDQIEIVQPMKGG